MKIDPHVHCRDGRESYKETIEHVFRLCDEQGVDIIFDMPNTDPPLLGPGDVEARLKLVPPGTRARYRLYMGATADSEQLTRAASMVREHESVIGLKLYAGSSVGPLAIVDEKDQQSIYEILAETGYTGVLAVHCEKQALTRDDLFDPDKPDSHARARPMEAETESISDQIRFARSAGFKGILHICHVSSAKSVSLIQAARKEIGITCGVTPHHLLWTSDNYRRADGLLYKLNPPLREHSETLALRDALKKGLIDWIETDHAPHALCEKLYPPYLSGYPSLCLYRHLVEEILPSWGIEPDMIKNLTHENITRVFQV